MHLSEVIEKRRAFRSLEQTEISMELIRNLAESASLAPSCFNNQPWHFLFVIEKEKLSDMFSALSQGNEWAATASAVVCVFSRKEDDCLPKNREYHLFDTGMATAFMILKATELGLVAHPIAGFREKKAKEVAGIPEEFTLITLIIVGKKSERISTILSEKQVEFEKARPERKDFSKFIYLNDFSTAWKN